MAALFGNSSQRGGGGGGKKNLLEFKAGKMYLQGKMCHADKRKGLVFIHQTEDSLMHFCWKDRTTGKVEEVCCHYFFFVFYVSLLSMSKGSILALVGLLPV